VKRLGITQRVENVESYNERRDCLDQRWSLLAHQLGYLTLPLANIQPELVPAYIDGLRLDAVLFSGGNTIASVDSAADNTAPERDAFELALIREVLERDIPAIAVCRGMQMINIQMGGGLSPITGHVAVRHSIVPAETDSLLPGTTNSYHDWSIGPGDLATGLIPLAFDSDGNIEAFRHPGKSVLGIMWHPEREQPFSELDLQLIKSYIP
jgi:gamma-glutamyl-gamma-aminobutyrate hydrolase PuuD